VQKLLANAFDSKDHSPADVHKAIDILQGSLASAEIGFGAEPSRLNAASQQNNNASSSKENASGFGKNWKRQGNGVSSGSNGKSGKTAPQMV
jgi:hypothetical protein